MDRVPAGWHARIMERDRSSHEVYVPLCGCAVLVFVPGHIVCVGIGFLCMGPCAAVSLSASAQLSSAHGFAGLPEDRGAPAYIDDYHVYGQWPCLKARHSFGLPHLPQSGKNAGEYFGVRIWSD